MDRTPKRRSDLWNDVVDYIEDLSFGRNDNNVNTPETILQWTIDAIKFVASERRLESDLIFIRLAKERAENA